MNPAGTTTSFATVVRLHSELRQLASVASDPLAADARAALRLTALTLERLLPVRLATTLAARSPDDHANLAISESTPDTRTTTLDRRAA